MQKWVHGDFKTKWFWIETLKPEISEAVKWQLLSQFRLYSMQFGWNPNWESGNNVLQVRLVFGFGKTCENDTFMCNSGNDGVIFFVSIRHTYILKYFNPP